MEEQGLYTGLNPEEMKALVLAWRAANKKIVQYWYDVNDAAISAVQEPGQLITLRHCKFIVKNGILFVQLPSGRLLSYIKPFIKKNKFEMDAVYYYGIDQKTSQWKQQDTYGGKLVENIVQGASRDVLADAMLRLDQAGYWINLHVHDETVSEIDIGTEDEMLKKAGEIMGAELPWVPGLPLKVESFITPFYIKEQ
jgi:DNA polymerase